MKRNRRTRDSEIKTTTVLARRIVTVRVAHGEATGATRAFTAVFSHARVGGVRTERIT